VNARAMGLLFRVRRRLAEIEFQQIKRTARCSCSEIPQASRRMPIPTIQPEAAFERCLERAKGDSK
jgi:hypothetical protein